jgi:N-hydroxyarylamine O-acetyltransferase
MTAIDHEALPAALTERVLQRLGLQQRPEPTLRGLHALYGAWCRRVPFDNVRKLLSLRSQQLGPLPGDDATDFFDAWLRDGTGGTCWAGAGALHALLLRLDFRPTRVIATMLPRPDAVANHGTVIVTIDDQRYLVDSAILHDAPMLVPSDPREWTTRWRPLHQLAGIDCRIDELDVSAERFRAAHEATRAGGPFNDQPYVRSNREDRVVGLAQGCRLEIDRHGNVARQELNPAATLRFLVDEIGISDAVAGLLLSRTL